MKTELIFGVLLIAAFLIAVPAMAQDVTIPISGKTLQTISLASTGAASGLTLPVGVTITDTVALQRSHNVPISLSIKDAMEASKPVELAGKMSYFFVSGGIYNPYASSQWIDTKTGFALGAGSYVTTSATAAPLASSLPAGEVSETLHIKNTVSFSDPVIPTASPDYLKLTVIIDAVPA